MENKYGLSHLLLSNNCQCFCMIQLTGNTHFITVGHASTVADDCRHFKQRISISVGVPADCLNEFLFICLPIYSWKYGFGHQQTLRRKSPRVPHLMTTALRSVYEIVLIRRQRI